MKCGLDRIVSELGDTQLKVGAIFERIRSSDEYTLRSQISDDHDDDDEFPVKPFQTGIVVNFLHSVVSWITSLSPSFALTLAASDVECLQGCDVTGLFTCCVIVQEGMHKLYDQRITDTDTGRNLLNWAVTTSHDTDSMHLHYKLVTTGTHHCCHVALKLVKQGRHCQLGGCK